MTAPAKYVEPVKKLLLRGPKDRGDRRECPWCNPDPCGETLFFGWPRRGRVSRPPRGEYGRGENGLPRRFAARNDMEGRIATSLALLAMI